MIRKEKNPNFQSKLPISKELYTGFLSSAIIEARLKRKSLLKYLVIIKVTD